MATRIRSPFAEPDRYPRLRTRLCPGCPIAATCPQWAEQLDACADAEELLQQADWEEEQECPD
jgi:hypothetical protein